MNMDDPLTVDDVLATWRTPSDTLYDWTIVLNLENLTEPEALAVLAQLRAIAGLHCEYGSTMGRDI